MAVYKLETLMEETRRLAADYRQSTGQSLPVSAELARFDAIRLLGLKPAEQNERGVDALMTTEQGDLKIQIKGRVIFDESKKSPRIGQLGLDADWDITLLVVMDADYMPQFIYGLDRAVIEQDAAQSRDNARGAMSVKKFEKLAELYWCASESCQDGRQ